MFAIASAALCALVAVTAVSADTEPAIAENAAPASVASPVFDPGFIITDALFYDGEALDTVGVQSFLDTQVTACASGIVCLADYSQKTRTRQADDVCDDYRGDKNETGAEIIAKVGRACGISQKALLVLLQKEQGLVRDPAPTAGDFSFATGYACPDTAACDTEYSGFYNQVYWAAWQLKRYANPPGTSEFFTSRPLGVPSPIAYNPQDSCGAVEVTLKNLATAALYYYTPYQPNPATVAGSLDDPCGAYGNLNFWKFYAEWFGDPLRGSSTSGALEGVTVVRGLVYAQGWALDPSSVRAATTVRVQVTDAAGRLTITTFGAASESRGALTESELAGVKHGFSGETRINAQGLVRVCAQVMPLPGSSAVSTHLGCKTVFALTP